MAMDQAVGAMSAKAEAALRGGAVPLTMRDAGATVQVCAIRGKDSTRRFLRELGFVEEAHVNVVSELNGNVIVNVKGTRVAISKAMAARILTN